MKKDLEQVKEYVYLGTTITQDVTQRAGGTILLRSLLQRKLRYAGHILRGSSTQLHNLILEGFIEGTRPRGRPRKRWMDDVFIWSHTRTYAETKRSAEDKGHWRRMVANLRIEDSTY